MWNQVFLTGFKEVQPNNLEPLALDLLLEFSLEYDIETARAAYHKNKAERAKKARPEKDVMKELGFSEKDLM